MTMPTIPYIAVHIEEKMLCLVNMSETIEVGIHLTDMLQEAITPMIHEPADKKTALRVGAYITSLLNRWVEQDRIYLVQNMWGTGSDHYRRRMYLQKKIK